MQIRHKQLLGLQVMALSIFLQVLESAIYLAMMVVYKKEIEHMQKHADMRAICIMFNIIRLHHLVPVLGMVHIMCLIYVQIKIF